MCYLCLGILGVVFWLGVVGGVFCDHDFGGCGGCLLFEEVCG